MQDAKRIQKVPIFNLELKEPELKLFKKFILSEIEDKKARVEKKLILHRLLPMEGTFLECPMAAERLPRGWSLCGLRKACHAIESAYAAVKHGPSVTRVISRYRAPSAGRRPNTSLKSGACPVLPRRRR